jgi:hypothetical protein
MTKRTFIVLTFVTLLLAIVLGLSHAVYFVFYSVGLMIYAVIVIARILIGEIKYDIREPSFKSLGFAIFPFIIALLIKMSIMEIKSFTAKEIIQKVNSFYSSNRHYPATLDEVGIKSGDVKYHYSSDSALNYYEIFYQYDPWTYRVYNSKLNSWRFED